MKKYPNINLAGEEVSRTYTVITTGEAGGIFTKVSVVIDSEDTHTDKQVEDLISKIKLDNMIAINGSFVKRILRINYYQDDVNVLYLQKYEMKSILTNSEEYQELIKESNAEKFDDSVQLVIMEEYIYILS